MTDQSIDLTADKPVLLEAVELELALQLQDIVSTGFEDSVQTAVEAAGYNFLFQFPANYDDSSQRVAAVSAGSGEDRRILLVHLDKDGETLKVEPAGEEPSSVANLAVSYAGLMDHLQAAHPA